MNIEWLQDFIILSRMKNSTRAAKARFVAQSAFSRRIRSLEDWAGVELINREMKPLELTHAGKDLSPCCATMCPTAPNCPT